MDDAVLSPGPSDTFSFTWILTYNFYQKTTALAMQDSLQTIERHGAHLNPLNKKRVGGPTLINNAPTEF